MTNPRYVVQLWGTNDYKKPHWMNVAHRGTLKAAEAEKAWLVAHGTKTDDIRIVRI